jgi:hypothetical protein
MPERRAATEQISGVIERVTFHNDDSGFCVLRVKTKGHREETGRGWLAAAHGVRGLLRFRRDSYRRQDAYRRYNQS